LIKRSFPVYVFIAANSQMVRGFFEHPERSAVTAGALD
jgi:hypothetical protein